MKTLISLSVLSLAMVHAAAASPMRSNQTQDLTLARQLVAQMTLDQKLGQMTLVKFTMLQDQPKVINWNNIAKYRLGALLVAGGEVPEGKGVIAGANDAKDYLGSTQENWITFTNLAKQHLPTVTFNGQTVRIPLLLGIDAIHGNQTVLGNVLFPQNIGLSATHDPALLTRIEGWTAHDIKAAGFNWAYAPTVAVSHSPNWGRYMETLGNQLPWVKMDAYAMVAGLQQINPRTHHITGVLATAKHFIGDGATWNGADEGNDHVKDFRRFLQVNKQGYIGAYQGADVGSIMISYSAINNQPDSFNQRLIAQKLKRQHLLLRNYQHLVVSDYGAVEKAASQGLPATTTTTPYPQALAQAVNAGIDLFMLMNTSSHYKTAADFQAILKQDVASGAIPLTRINDAVAHIIASKMAMGLLSYTNGHWQTHQPVIVPQHTATQASPKEVKRAVQAADESFVLLKNQHHVLPLNPHRIKYVVLVGDSLVNQRNDAKQQQLTLYPNYNNIGAQNGGWTVAWQGTEGNTLFSGANKARSGATSVLDGLRQVVPNATLLYPHYHSNTNMASIAQDRGDFLKTLKTEYPDMTAANTVILGTLADIPTAEFMGDINVPYCRHDDTNFDKGCLYNLHLNPYLPNQERRSLAIHYHAFAQSVIRAVEQKTHDHTPVVSVLISGRPMIISTPLHTGPLDTSQAFIAAWLPGTSGGQAIADAVFGQYHFRQHGLSNTLSAPWVRDMASLRGYPVYTVGSGVVQFARPLFTAGYGLKD